MDSVCSTSSAPCLIKLSKYAKEIVDALNTNLHLQPIVPSVTEFQNGTGFSKFLVGTVANYHLYCRGPKGVPYLGDPNNTQQQPIPWNIHHDTLSEEARKEWVTWELENKSVVKDSYVRPSRRVLEVRLWIKKKYRIVDIQPPANRLRHNSVYSICP